MQAAFSVVWVLSGPQFVSVNEYAFNLTLSNWQLEASTYTGGGGGRGMHARTEPIIVPRNCTHTRTHLYPPSVKVSHVEMAQ